METETVLIASAVIIASLSIIAIGLTIVICAGCAFDDSDYECPEYNNGDAEQKLNKKGQIGITRSLQQHTSKPQEPESPKQHRTQFQPQPRIQGKRTGPISSSANQMMEQNKDIEDYDDLYFGDNYIEPIANMKKEQPEKKKKIKRKYSDASTYSATYTINHLYLTANDIMRPEDMDAGLQTNFTEQNTGGVQTTATKKKDVNVSLAVTIRKKDLLKGKIPGNLKTKMEIEGELPVYDVIPAEMMNVAPANALPTAVTPTGRRRLPKVRKPWRTRVSNPDDSD